MTLGLLDGVWLTKARNVLGSAMARCGVLMMLPAALCACVAGHPAPCLPLDRPDHVAWLVDQGWHTEIGLPVEDIDGPLAVFRRDFPTAKVLMFGFGKRTFITAKVESLSELLMGPIPGPGAIQVVGLRVVPAQAYSPGQVTRLSMRKAELDRLAVFIWNAVGKTHDGQPRLISPGLFPGSLFYASVARYGPTYTCNTWTAQALQSAGLPVTPKGVILAGGLLDQTKQLARACLVSQPAP
jgi:hypothetical protein